MYNENEKRNIAVSQKGNAIQPAALNIHQLFPSRTKDECLLELKKNPSVYRTYLNWPDKWKKRFLEFMEGKKSLPLTYDPFFKKLFNPDVYPERLSRLISSIIGTNVTVKCILSNEDSMLPSTSLLLLDIIVQLEDGSIANVEIQKIPYTFPGERMSCYSADLLLRQYTRVKGEKGSTFTYQDLKTVYTIVMFENSPKNVKIPNYPISICIMERLHLIPGSTSIFCRNTMSLHLTSSKKVSILKISTNLTHGYPC